MTRRTIFLISDDDPLPAAFDGVARLLRAVRQVDLGDGDLAAARGLITTTNLDQIDFAGRQAALSRFLVAGGRLVFNGHVVLPFLPGLQLFRPLASRRRADLDLVRLGPHPVLDGIAVAAHLTQRGVAGFYGRGHNPPLPGARPLTGIGPDRLPVDWEWLLPSGGGLLVHAGNDIWGTSDDATVNRRLAERLVTWSLADRPAQPAR